mmetsp:Transcript_11988/g.28128  ORF Transcript_11988/g.28128 Transcript_11988/m.28128 type:complete len:201 (+) Transcript_11988:1463-2065(+)
MVSVTTEEDEKKLGQTLPPILSSHSAATVSPNNFPAKKSITPCHTGQTGSLANFSSTSTRLCNGCSFDSTLSSKLLVVNADDMHALDVPADGRGAAVRNAAADLVPTRPRITSDTSQTTLQRSGFAISDSDLARYPPMVFLFFLAVNAGDKSAPCSQCVSARAGNAPLQGCRREFRDVSTAAAYAGHRLRLERRRLAMDV